jgi:hypothetical protein
MTGGSARFTRPIVMRPTQVQSRNPIFEREPTRHQVYCWWFESCTQITCTEERRRDLGTSAFAQDYHQPVHTNVPAQALNSKLRERIAFLSRSCQPLPLLLHAAASTVCDHVCNLATAGDMHMRLTGAEKPAGGVLFRPCRA